jgi:hypothetical protein
LYEWLESGPQDQCVKSEAQENQRLVAASGERWEEDSNTDFVSLQKYNDLDRLSRAPPVSHTAVGYSSK